jgi:predicted phosphatase
MINDHLKPQLTKEDYAKAINTLLLIAQLGTGSSRPCAMVLLNAYNADAFHVDIVDLYRLDDKRYSAAIVAIRARVELHIEPHEVIDNGNAVFKDLWREWQDCCLLNG